MWTCQHCGEKVENSFDRCWNCGTFQDGSPPEEPPPIQQEGNRRTKKRWRGAFVVLLCSIGSVILLQCYLLDGIDGILEQWFYEADTAVYAPGYSDRGFRRIRKGMSSQEVIQELGEPIMESWIYPQKPMDDSVIYFLEKKLEAVRLVVESDWHFLDDAYAKEMFPTFQKGQTTMAEVQELLGKPQYKSWAYSYSPGSGSYRARKILLKEEIVQWRHSFYYVD